MSRLPNAGRPGTQVHAVDQSRQPPKILTPPRSAQVRLKAIIRRLPPGLTEFEFQKALGDEWRAGSEKVDWYSFKEGKITKDISKPSIPGRVYLNLTKQEYLGQLSTAVRDADFADAKNTAGDSSLLGPPLVELCTYGRIPTSKPRKDARQGTIDQDLEFMSFLQALTNPIMKPTPIDAQATEKANLKSGDAVTPLIQFLRDKKASKDKGKEQPPSKTMKQSRQESKDAKTSTAEKVASKAKNNKDAASSADKKTTSALKVEKPREPVKVLSKHSANVPKPPQGQAASTTSKGQGITEARPPSTPSERKQRKVGSEAKSLLQRDLGIGTSTGSRRKRNETNPAPTSASNTSRPGARRESVGAQNAQGQAGTLNEGEQHNLGSSVISKSNQNTSATPSKNISSNTSGPATPREPGPLVLSNKPTPTPSQAAPANGPGQATGTATQAFLKHANASQGVTEPLLQAAMSVFGQVDRVDIDKKKGFAYVDFGSSASLKAAMAASPVKVGQGSVVVLERREKATKQEKSVKSGGVNAAQPISSTNSSTEKTATSPSPVNATVTAGTGRGGSQKSHRPRGNRGRGLGRGGGGANTEKTTSGTPSQGLETKGQ